MFLIIMKCGEISFEFFQELLIVLKAISNHLKECFILFPNTSKLVEKKKVSASFFQPICQCFKIR